MEIKDFIQEGKLVIPIEEIDNIYTWTRISKTQELLLSSKAYFKLMEKSFNDEVSKFISVLKSKSKLVTDDSYKLSDFITFRANTNNIFNGKTCFVYSNNDSLLTSLTCYLAHSRNVFNPKFFVLSEVIITRVDNPSIVKELFDTELAVIQIYGKLPDHKYKSSTLEGLFIHRCADNHYTLVDAINYNHLFDDDKNIRKLAEKHGVKDISKLGNILAERRKAGYKELMQLWYSMVSNTNNMVYSHEQPKISQRTIGSNNG